jgi:hypothetical protein
MEQHEITAPDVRLHYVRLTNHLDVPFTDRHDGVPVSIGPGKSDNFPIDMAAHFFGNVMDPQASFRHVCKRQGWNTPAHLKPSETNPNKTVAELLFSKLEIKPVIYKMVEEKPDLEQPIPADPLTPDGSSAAGPLIEERQAKPARAAVRKKRKWTRRTKPAAAPAPAPVEAAEAV